MLLSTEHNNVFAFAFGKVMSKLSYLDIIQERYDVASQALIANSNAVFELAKALPSGTRTPSPEERELQNRAGLLSVGTHLEIESFYIFAKMLLDDVARAIEYYFGQANNCSLDSHDDLTKKLARYAAGKQLAVPDGFEQSLNDLKRRIADVRDKRISHEKSPRTVKGTGWGGTSDGARIVLTRIYPNERDEQFETEELGVLRAAIDGYLLLVIRLIDDNHERTVLSREDI